jgi:hypothetical protein
MHVSSQISSFLLFSIAFLSTTSFAAHVKHLSNTPFIGDTKADFISKPYNFEAPHLSAANGSSFQWWWFDVLTSSTNRSALNIIFFDAANAAFPLTLQPNNLLSIFISAYSANGTQYEYSIPIDSATVKWGNGSKLDLGNGVIGNFLSDSINGTFSSPIGLSSFSIEVSSPTFGIEGSLNFKSTAPPHYACSTNIGANQALEVLPNIGWANAMPSASVTGTFSFGNGTESLHFHNALGYHDMNWSTQSLFSAIDSWYWGHAKLGPYTIVWFDGLDKEGVEHSNAYVAHENGEILLASCSPGSVTVRPQGKGAQYPPDSQHSGFSSLHVVFETSKGPFVVDVVPGGTNLAYPGLYQLDFGSVKGGLQGGAVFEGIGEFEEFTVLGFGA